MSFRTPPLTIIDLPTKNLIYPGMVNKKELIILHATAGSDSRKWMVQNREFTSAHRLIRKDGTIYKLADDNVILGHVGFSRLGNDIDLNDRALGLEIENLNDGSDPYPANQVLMVAKQVVEWWGMYGISIPLLRHYQVDTTGRAGAKGKTDPRAFPWHQFDTELQKCLKECL